MTVDIDAFLAKTGPCLDVRSPKEFQHAKIPGSINLPLFSDEERALVGTAYKRQGKDVAIRLGVKLVGPKLESMLAFADKEITSKEPVRVYCWRGGMRSGFVSYFLHFTGYPTLQLKGGYKAFRRFALSQLAKPLNLCVVGGFTGVGKTEILSALERQGEQVLDLEKLASHRGSVYGEVEGQTQPSNEQFENEIAMSLVQTNLKKSLWVEDESRLIGHCQIPGAFYEAKSRAPLFVIEAPKEVRIQRILQMYTSFPKEYWQKATLKIQKRLGGATTQKVLEHIQENRLVDGIVLLLDYYDRAYEHAISRHLGKVVRFSEKELSVDEWAKVLSDSQKNN
jgi:tRNA 2-selenouridine synthase